MGVRRGSRRQSQEAADDASSSVSNASPMPPTFPLSFADVVLYDMSVERFPDNIRDVAVPSGSANAELASPLLHDDRVEIAMRVTIHFPDKERPMFIIRATLNGIFLFATAEAATLVPEFAKATASSLMWPYVRELIQSLSIRMRVPPLILPTLDLRQIQPDQNATQIPEPE